MSLSKDASISDVAKLAGVSLGTVSRVMNRAENVTAEMRERVYIASRRLGFVPRRSYTTLAVVTGRQSPALPVGYVSVVTSLITRFASQNQCRLEIIDIENMDFMFESYVDGVIGVVFDHRLADLTRYPNLPIVTINHPMTDKGLHSLRADHYQQAVMATEHLVAKGHQKIAFMATEADEWGAQERLRGYQEVMGKAGVEIVRSWVQYSAEQRVYDILTRWVNQGVTAILNFSEDSSLEVLHILSNILRLRIGTDISIISLEDLPIYQYLQPPQTTIRQPLAELARLAVENMLALVNAPLSRGKKPSTLVDICLGSELVERDSVAVISKS